jgi:hypothetical protein
MFKLHPKAPIAIFWTMVGYAVIYMLMNALKHSGFEKTHLLYGMAILLVGFVALVYHKLM